MSRVDEQLPDRQVGPARQIGRIEQHAVLEIHGPGRTESDRLDLVPTHAALLDGQLTRRDQVIEADHGSRCPRASPR